MVASICRHSVQDWQPLIENRLDPKRTEELTRHVEHCSACRAQWEKFCAPPELWAESTDALRSLETQLEFPTNSPMPRQFEMATSSSLDVPLQIHGYSIQGIVGYGGMGTVHKAWDARLFRTVAIKVLHPHLACNGTARSRFAREAQAVACVSHPNVVPIHDVSADHAQPLIVMGYAPGGSLQEKLDRDGPMPLEDALRIAVQIAEGLDAAHAQGLIHRDIKPANILLESPSQRIMITDFGLARALDDASLTASGFLAGTPQYMSPEQASGKLLDHRSDLYSLGSVLYAMIAGVPPYRGESSVGVLREVAEGTPKPIHFYEPRLPAWTQKLLDHFHAREPNQRFASAAEAIRMMQACLQYLASPAVIELPNSLQPAATALAGRVWVFVLSLLFIGGITAGWLGLWQPRRAGNDAISSQGNELRNAIEENRSAIEQGPFSIDATEIESMMDEIERELENLKASIAEPLR